MVLVEWKAFADFEYHQYPVAMLRAAWFLTTFMCTIVNYVVYSTMFRPLLYINKSWYWKIDGLLYKWCLIVWMSWIWTCGHTVEAVGDDVSAIEQEEALLLPNHLSMADTPLLMYAFHGFNAVLDNMMWTLSANFKWLPFGWACQARGDIFVHRGKKLSIETEMHLKESYTKRGRKWLILFPEGYFLKQKKEQSRRYAKSRGYPVLDNTLLPHMGMVQMVLNALNCKTASQEFKEKRLRFVVDVTIGYPNGIPLDLPNLMFNTLTPRKIQILYRVFPISEVPAEPDELQEWIFQLWTEKDEALETFYRTGQFRKLDRETDYNKGNKHGRRRIVTLNTFVVILMNVIELCKAYFIYVMLKFILNIIL